MTLGRSWPGSWKAQTQELEQSWRAFLSPPSLAARVFVLDAALLVGETLCQGQAGHRRTHFSLNKLGPLLLKRERIGQWEAALFMITPREQHELGVYGHSA